MRVIFNRTDLVDTGWTLDAKPIGLMASHEDREGKVVIVLRDLGERLEFTTPSLESFNDGKFMAHLFDVLAENDTAYTILP